MPEVQKQDVDLGADIDVDVSLGLDTIDDADEDEDEDEGEVEGAVPIDGTAASGTTTATVSAALRKTREAEIKSATARDPHARRLALRHERIYTGRGVHAPSAVDPTGEDEYDVDSAGNPGRENRNLNMRFGASSSSSSSSSVPSQGGRKHSRRRAAAVSSGYRLASLGELLRQGQLKLACAYAGADPGL